MHTRVFRKTIAIVYGTAKDMDWTRLVRTVLVDEDTSSIRDRGETKKLQKKR